MGLRIVYDPSIFGYDLALDEDEQRFETDDGLLTAVTISLFTDARATAEELALYGLTAADNRGWYGDSYPEIEGDTTGSKLWLLARALRNDETLRVARTYALASLQWMVDDGVALEIDAGTEWIGTTSYLQLTIAVLRRDGSQWRAVWNAFEGALLSAA